MNNEQLAHDIAIRIINDYKGKGLHTIGDPVTAPNLSDEYYISRIPVAVESGLEQLLFSDVQLELKITQKESGYTYVTITMKYTHPCGSANGYSLGRAVISPEGNIKHISKTDR